MKTLDKTTIEMKSGPGTWQLEQTWQGFRMEKGKDL